MEGIFNILKKVAFWNFFEQAFRPGKFSASWLESNDYLDHGKIGEKKEIMIKKSKNVVLRQRRNESNLEWK